MMDGPNKPGRTMVVAVLLFVLVAPGLFPLSVASLTISSPAGENARSGAVGPRIINDPITESIGAPSYYSSLLSISGLGTLTGRSSDLLAIQWDDDPELELVTFTLQGYIEAFDPPTYRLSWRSPPVPGGIYSISKGDINNDTHEDLVVGAGNGFVFVYSREVVTSPELVPIAWGFNNATSPVTFVGVVDYDDDGRKDVLTVTGDYSTLIYLHNEPVLDEIGIRLNRTIKYTPGYDIEILKVADSDDDGIEEILLSYYYYQYTRGLVVLHKNDLDQAWSISLPSNPVDLDIIDIDNDGDSEIITTIFLYPNIPVINAKDHSIERNIELTYYFISRVEAGDFNGDGSLELFMTAQNHDDGYQYMTLYNYTNNTFGEVRLLRNEVPLGITSGMFGANGTLLAAYTDTGGLIVLSLVPDNGNNFTFLASRRTVGYDAFGLDAYDWDQDGIIEVFSGSNQGYLSVIDPLTGDIEAQDSRQDYSRGSVMISDTDMDGTPEIITGNLGNLSMLEMNFTPVHSRNIGYRSDTWTSDTRAPLAISDIDLDGSPEILVGTEAPTVHVLNGTNMSNEDIYWGTNGKIRAMITSDLDGNGAPEIITGDTVGVVSIITGPQIQLSKEQFYDFGPYGLATADTNEDGEPELIVGSAKGILQAIDIDTFSAVSSSTDLGQEAWGICHADLDSDGENELLVGMGSGQIIALNGTTLTKKWQADLGEWIGPYNSILVKDLDMDGHLEAVIGSDGYVYVIRLLTSSEKPNISTGPLVVPDILEDGRILEFKVPVTVSGPITSLNVSVEFRLEPTGANVSGGRSIGSVWKIVSPGTYTYSVNWTGSPGSWKLVATADPDNIYSEPSENDNSAERELVVQEVYAKLEWFAGQGTGLGRYHGLALGDDDSDGSPELLVGSVEGFVQSYRVGAALDTSGNKTVSPYRLSEDMGSSPYGMIVSDVDVDGDAEVLVSTGEGFVYSFAGIGDDLEWMTQVSESPCFGLDAADLDQDGGVEIVAGCGNSRLYVLDGADGAILRQATVLFEQYAIDIADIGNDGTLDIVTAGQDGTVHILSSKNLGMEAEFRLASPQVDDILVSDADRDGRNEILFGDRDGNVLMIGTIANTSNTNGWDLTIDGRFEAGSTVIGVELADITKDPGMELLVGMHDRLRAYRYHEGSFEQIGNASLAGDLGGILAGDVDKDGQCEIVVSTLLGDFSILGGTPSYKGNQTSIAFIVQSYLPGLGVGLYGTDFGDLNGDGAPELLLGTAEGKLRVYDGISKELEMDLDGMGADLFGLKVRDIDADGDNELLTGSGEETVCAYEPEGDRLTKLWCSQKLGDWAIAFDVADLDLDNVTEMVVASGPKVYLLDAATGKITNSTYELGKHILGLALGELDGDKWPELVVGTEDGYLHIFNANNLTKPWGITLDSWPVGLAISDVDGDGIGTIFASTDGAVYEISLKDREVLWSTELGEGSWGLTTSDYESDGLVEVFCGLRDGRVLALNASKGDLRWGSTFLGSRAGWYNSLKAGDMDLDGQNELLVGSSGYLYLFGAGYIKPKPIPDALLEGMELEKEELSDGETTNVSVKLYDHSMAPISDLTIHLLVDGVYVDSAVIDYMSALERVDVVFPYTAKGGEHNITVKLDMYDTVKEFNEGNNEMTIIIIALGAVNLAIEGGSKGIRFSEPPIKGVEVTVFADIRNTGEEASSAAIKFYWANMRLFGQAQVYVRGREKVVAAVNWTPEDSGEWDIIVVIEPEGFDGEKDDNTATKQVHILSHPSVSILDVSMPNPMVEDLEYLVPVNISNKGEAGTTGSLVLYIDDVKAWSSGELLIPAGTSQVTARLMATAGQHIFHFALEGIVLDDKITDNDLNMNLSVSTRPDMTFDLITKPKENLLVVGREIFIAVIIANRGGSNGTCMVKAYDNGAIFYEDTIVLTAGTTKTLQVPWKVSKGDHNIELKVLSTTPAEYVTGNNRAEINLFVSGKAGVTETNWPLLSLLFIGIMAPLIAVIFYYSQVQPVREAARRALEEEQMKARLKTRARPVKKTNKKTKRTGDGGN